MVDMLRRVWPDPERRLGDVEVVLCRSPPGRLHDPEDWAPVDVLEREEDVVGCLVDCNGMGMRGESRSPLIGQGRPAHLEDGDDSTFGGDVQALEAVVIGEYIRVRADLGERTLGHGREIDCGETAVSFTGNEREAGAFFEIQAVGAGASTEADSGSDGSVGRIDAYELVWRAHSRED